MSRGAIEDVEHTVTIRPHHRLARTPADLDIAQHRHLRRIPIELIVRRELVVPLELSCIGIQRDHRRAIQVVAHAIVTVVVGTRITRAPHGEVGLRIVRAGHPNRCAAVQIRIVGLAVLAEPRLISRLTRTRYRVEAPHFVTRVDIVGRKETSHTMLAAGDTGDHFVLHDDRRDRHRILLLVIGDRCIP